VTGAPTWYDLLDVAPDASTDEVRAAGKSQIADLEPGDRRFDALNRAARVLLDPAARAAYDASLATADQEEQDEPPLVEEPPAVVSPPKQRRVLAVPSWLLIGLGTMATVLVAATAWTWWSGTAGVEDAVRAAQTAAERAVVPALSYDHEDLEGGQARAGAVMTGKYRAEYDKLFAVIAENAPSTQTKVAVEVVSSGIVRASEDRVQVLVFVDRPTTNRRSAEPTVYKDQVTLSMQRVDDEWLVDDMVTSPVSG
jgi:Mce-associated membrane protein